MRWCLPLALCLVMVVGCGEGFPRLPLSPGNDAQTAPLAEIGSFRRPWVIQVGDKVDVAVPKGWGEAYHFTLTAPADGTLVVRLEWDAPGNEVLQMSVGGTIFGMHTLAQDGLPDLSLYTRVDGKRSLVGSVSARSGGDYRIWVANVPGYWDYGEVLESPFILTTSLQ